MKKEIIFRIVNACGYSDLHQYVSKSVNSLIILNNEEFSQQLMESIITHIYKSE
jgi:hypothetical protein